MEGTQEHPLQVVQNSWLPCQGCQICHQKEADKNAMKYTDIMDLQDMHVKSLKVFLSYPIQGSFKPSPEP